MSSRQKNELRKIPLKQILKDTEMALIEQAMMESQNNQSLAARLLGISRGKLLYKLKEYAKISMTIKEEPEGL